MTLGPSRRAALLALLLPLAACAGGESPAPQSFAPLSYSYLTPLHLDAANLSVEDRAVPQGGDDVADRSPVVPAQALEQMARDRIFPGGSAGTATFTVEQASILRRGDRLDGRLAVRLDLAGTGRSGHAEAQVSRSTVGGGGDLRARLYALTKQMMDDMNVEFEYQVRHSLSGWLQSDSAAPAAVSIQTLSGAPAASPAPVAAPAASGAPPAALAPTPLTAPGSGAPGGGGATPVTMSPPPGVLTAPSGMRPSPAAPPSAALPAPTPLTPIPYQPPAAPTPYATPTPYAAPSYAPPGYAPPGYAAPPSSIVPAPIQPAPSPAYAVPAPTY